MDDAPATSLVLVRPGPRWEPDRPLAAQRYAAAHMAWIRKHVASGTALIAGPIWHYNEPLTGDLVGVLVLNLPVDAATALTRTDPAVIAERLTMSVHPFYRVVVDPEPTPDGSGDALDSAAAQRF